MTWMVDQKSRRKTISKTFWQEAAAAVALFVLANVMMAMVIDAIMRTR